MSVVLLAAPAILGNDEKHARRHGGLTEFVVESRQGQHLAFGQFEIGSIIATETIAGGHGEEVAKNALVIDVFHNDIQCAEMVQKTPALLWQEAAALLRLG